MLCNKNKSFANKNISNLIQDISRLGGGINVNAGHTQLICNLPETINYDNLMNIGIEPESNRRVLLINNTIGEQQHKFAFEEITENKENAIQTILSEINIDNWFMRGFNLNILVFPVQKCEPHIYQLAEILIQKLLDQQDSAEELNNYKVCFARYQPTADENFNNEELIDIAAKRRVNKLTEVTRLNLKAALDCVEQQIEDKQLKTINKVNCVNNDVIQIRYYSDSTGSKYCTINLVQMIDNFFNTQNYQAKYEKKFQQQLLKILNKNVQPQTIQKSSTVGLSSRNQKQQQQQNEPFSGQASQFIQFFEENVFKNSRNVVFCNFQSSALWEGSITLSSEYIATQLKNIWKLSSLQSLCYKFDFKRDVQNYYSQDYSTSSFKLQTQNNESGQKSTCSQQQRQSKSLQHQIIKQQQQNEFQENLEQQIEEPNEGQQSEDRFTQEQQGINNIQFKSIKTEMDIYLNKLERGSQEKYQTIQTDDQLTTIRKNFNTLPASQKNQENQNQSQISHQQAILLQQQYETVRTGKQQQINYPAYQIEKSQDENRVLRLKVNNTINNLKQELNQTKIAQDLQSEDYIMQINRLQQQVKQLLKNSEFENISELYEKEINRLITKLQNQSNQIEYFTSIKGNESLQVSELKNIIISLNKNLNEKEDELVRMKREQRKKQVQMAVALENKNSLAALKEERDQLIIKNDEMICNIDKLNQMIKFLKEQNNGVIKKSNELFHSNQILTNNVDTLKQLLSVQEEENYYILSNQSKRQDNNNSKWNLPASSNLSEKNNYDFIKQTIQEEFDKLKNGKISQDKLKDAEQVIIQLWQGLTQELTRCKSQINQCVNTFSYVLTKLEVTTLLYIYKIKCQ